MPQVPQDSPAGADRAFGERLRDLRQAAGLTQQQLADMLTEAGTRLDNTAVARIERGQRAIYVGEAVALARILDVPIEILADTTTAGWSPAQARMWMLIHRRMLLEAQHEAAQAEVERIRRDIAAVDADFEQERKAVYEQERSAE